MPLSDHEFVQEFEDLSLPPSEFGHRGHLRLAWLYLQDHSLEACIDKIARHIRAYATHLGAADKYHHTLSAAIVTLMAQPAKASASFDAFVDTHPEFLQDLPTMIAQYYSQMQLEREAAKTQFLAPDIQPFPMTNE